MQAQINSTMVRFDIKKGNFIKDESLLKGEPEKFNGFRQQKDFVQKCLLFFKSPHCLPPNQLTKTHKIT